MLDPDRTRWFGAAWNPHLCEPEYQVPVPVGQRCAHCEEGFEPHDDGVLMNGGTVPFHYECMMRLVFGPVGHQAGWCSCHGGDPHAEVEPEAMTKRQAAKAAVRLYEQRQRGRRA